MPTSSNAIHICSRRLPLTAAATISPSSPLAEAVPLLSLLACPPGKPEVATASPHPPTPSGKQATRATTVTHSTFQFPLLLPSCSSRIVASQPRNPSLFLSSISTSQISKHQSLLRIGKHHLSSAQAQPHRQAPPNDLGLELRSKVSSRLRWWHEDEDGSSKR
jgi:hypothetical protein